METANNANINVINNIPNDLNDIDFNETITIDKYIEMEPRKTTLFEVVDYNIDNDVATLTILLTDNDTGKGIADALITFYRNNGDTLDTLELIWGKTDENGYVTFTIPYTFDNEFKFTSLYGNFVFGIYPSSLIDFDDITNLLPTRDTIENFASLENKMERIHSNMDNEPIMSIL